MGDAELHKHHRQRMFARYDSTGINGFEEHEVLEMLLYYTIKRRNTNETAHLLLNRFGSVSGVIHAPVEKLVQIQGVGEETARYLRLWGSAFDRQDFVKIPTKLTQDNTQRFLTSLFKDRDREEFYIICLSPSDDILACEMLGRGSFESSEVNVGGAIKTALDHNSAQVVFAHNHPSGIDVASDADIAVTGVLLSAMSLVGVRLRDHIIVAGNKCVSIMQNYKVKVKTEANKWSL